MTNYTIEDDSENEVTFTEVELSGDIDSEEIDDSEFGPEDSEEDAEEENTFTDDDVIIVMDRLNINSTNIQTYILDYENLPEGIKKRVSKAVDLLEDAYQKMEEYLK